MVDSMRANGVDTQPSATKESPTQTSGETADSTSTSTSWTTAVTRGKDPAGLTTARKSKHKKFDWLEPGYGDDLTPFQDFIVNGVDWNTSPVGPIEHWPAWLKRMVTLVVSDPTPAVVYVDNEDGETDTIIYNEAYPYLIGSKHPSLQGHDPRIGFAEIWPTFIDILARGRENFETVVGDAQPLLLARHGFLEETWFSWKFTPIIGPDGWVVGSHATVVENTREIMLDRRLSTLQSIDQKITSSATTDDLWHNLAEAMEPNTSDMPFVLLYSAVVNHGQTTGRERSPVAPPLSISLEAAIGEGAEQAAPSSIDLEVDTGLGFYCRDSMVNNKTTRLSAEVLPDELRSVFRSRETAEPCTHAIICPIQSPSSKSAVGFILLAENPRRPWDDDYADFVSRLATQTSSTANRLLLSEQLRRRTKEFKESETKFSRFASRAPLGLALFDKAGNVEFANEFWYRLFDYPRDDISILDEDGSPLWLDRIHVEDRENVWAAWTRVVDDKENVKVQFRITTLRSAFNAKDPESGMTILCQAFADLDENGEIISVMSCLTDVSELKDLEEKLRARTREVEAKMEHVLEMKRQQENFIDMTSHEIRNPLSAVLHLAEEMFNASNDILMDSRVSSIQTTQNETIGDAMKGLIEGAETITACVLHQKRIVDDILVLSRLDSELLQVTPVATQPKDLIHSALKMFEAEIRTADMSLKFEEDDSLRDLNVDWLMFDPNRVIQILVNLVGNAIKFTKTQDVRDIVVTMSASRSRPPSGTDHIDFVPVKNSSTERLGADYNDASRGETIYLSMGVSDTGQGLSPDEKKMLFQRFSQGSKRTHTKYGGSGLGLWISKQLTELHGGQIGISTKERQGSNFLFYIQTRRCAPPEDYKRRPDITQETSKATETILSQAAAKPLEDLEPSERPLAVRHRSNSALSAEPPATQEEKKISVLVVEDNLVNQRIIAKQLRKQGCIVNVANHGQEALDFLQTTVFWKHDPEAGTVMPMPGQAVELSIILMDLEMPVMDGLTAVREIRRLQSEGRLNAHIPVLAVTANARGEQLSAALDAGMDSSITKPYSIPDIMKKIKELSLR